MSSKRIIWLLLWLALAAIPAVSVTGQPAAAQSTKTAGLVPPEADIRPVIDSTHGDIRVDNYYWMRNRDDSALIPYLEAENEYAVKTMANTEPLQEKLYQEMRGRIKEEDISVPVKEGPYYYYSRDVEGKQYKVYCRKQGSLDAEEEVILDVNKLAEGKDFMRIGPYDISPDHQLLAYGYDDSGNERYSMRFKNLQNGTLMPEIIEGISNEVVFANDNKTAFYTVPDDAWRTYRLYRHVIGSDSSEDVLVYEEPDERFWMSIGKTKDKRYLLLYLGSEVTSEFRYLDADNPTGEFTMIAPRREGIEYNVSHRDGLFYILTNEDAVNFKVVTAPVSTPGPANWKAFLPYDASIKTDAVETFKDFLVLYQRVDGLQTIRVYDFASDEYHNVSFPETVYSYYGHANPEFDSDLFRFTYESMVTPPSVYDYNMRTRERELKKQKEVLGDFDASAYTQEREMVPSYDGVLVPMSMVYRKGMKRNGESPVYLYGYGAYGIPMDPWFSTNRISLLDRGFIFAIAHIRGGGEMGRPWYEDGKLLHKQNTFRDFIACAQYLIDSNYTQRDKLVISGGSAGGLLIGAVVNFRPQLFCAAVADVPFVDIINTMLDESIPLTVIEYDEWGNPHDKEYYDYMKQYSPYDNVGQYQYPHMLVTSGLNDTRVQYWEPSKWVAKLRARKRDNNMLLYKINMGAGHGGKSGRFDYLKDLAFEYAFVIDAVSRGRD